MKQGLCNQIPHDSGLNQEDRSDHEVEDDPSTPTNHETNFFKFLKKDFEDLSLGPIKRPKKKKIATPEGMSGESANHAALEPPEDQESAAAAWRAARAQKSCLHSGKPGGGKDTSGGEDGAGAKWTQLETTWRLSTLPFRSGTLTSPRL
jgi:hypothetical protein